MGQPIMRCFTQLWAMTETTCICSYFYHPENDDTASVGRFMPNIDVKLVDPDPDSNGEEVGHYDVRGELCVRGPSVIDEYFSNPKANADSWDEDGYFKTGDIMYCDSKSKKWYIVDRKKELIKSGLQLGLRSASDIHVIEDKNFPDSMTVTWHPRLISNMLTTTFAPKMASISSKDPPQTTIDTIITFDAHGISSHPNHISLYNGAHAFLKALMHRHSGWECPIKLYTLTTTNILRKYVSLLDSPVTLISAMGKKRELGVSPTPLLFVSSPAGYRTAQKAMTTAHESQMRWFRWGWISFSRYMVLNDLKKEKTR